MFRLQPGPGLEQFVILRGEAVPETTFEFPAIRLEDGHPRIPEELPLLWVNDDRYVPDGCGCDQSASELRVENSLVIILEQQDISVPEQGDRRDFQRAPDGWGERGGHLVIKPGDLLTSCDDAGLGCGGAPWHREHATGANPERFQGRDQDLSGGIVAPDPYERGSSAQRRDIRGNIRCSTGGVPLFGDGDDWDRGLRRNSFHIAEEVAVKHQVTHDQDVDVSHRLKQLAEALAAEGVEDVGHGGKLLDIAPATLWRYLRPPMARFDIVATRGEIDESVHRISAAVTDADGLLVASAGSPDLVTYFRSAAKPFQLWPLVRDGGVERFGLDPEMLALACGSHNAEPMHRAVGARWLERVGLSEQDLSCGGHPSLSSSVAREMIRTDVRPTALWSNCSGKHAALLALTRLHGWPLEGYTKVGHPVQGEVAASMAHWSGVPASALQWGEDGCTAAAVAMPLTGIATAWARLGTSDEPAMARIRSAMLAHPAMIAGSDRLDTSLMAAWPGRVLAKVGADGVYGAALPTLGLGIGLKVEDGHFPSAGHALMAILVSLTSRFGAGSDWPLDQLTKWRTPPILNTRGAPVGAVAVRGGLTFA